MRTALNLSNDQISRMLMYVKERMAGIDQQRAEGWLEARERWEKEYQDDFAHRAVDSAVFSQSNESLGLIAGAVEFLRARLIEEIFGVEPWLGVTPRTRAASNPELAEMITRHLTWKLGPEQINFTAHASEVITTACVLGECVSKIAHVTESDSFERFATILIDKVTGKPATDQTGEFIFQDHGTTQLNAPTQEDQTAGYEHPSGHPEFQVSTTANGVKTPNPGYAWAEQVISDQNVRYVGAKAIPLHFKEFYIPLNAKSIQEADFVAHKTSMRLSNVLTQLGMTKDGKPIDAPEGSDGNDPATSHIQTIISRIRGETSDLKAASDQPIQEQGEGSLPMVLDGDPEFVYVEAYFTFDVFNDGRPLRIFFTFAYDSETPICWDYIANVTPDGKYPFSATVMNQVGHRWYGTSWFKKYERSVNLVDKLLNQVIYRNHLAANPIGFRRKDAVVQWQDDQPFESGAGVVYDLNDGFTAKDAVEYAEVPQLDEQTREILDMAVANFRTRSGVATATQGEFGKVPAENTATGTQRIVATGNTAFKPIILDVKRGLEAEIRMLAECQYYYQDNEEYTYQQNDQQLIGLLTPDKVKDLDLVIELKLTNLKATERLQQSQLAANMANQFLAVPDQYKETLREIYEQIFQSLQIDNADQIIDTILKIVSQTAQQNGPQFGKVLETMAFKDLAGYPEAQVKFLIDAGLLTQQEAQTAINRQSQETNNEPAQTDTGTEDRSQAGPANGNSGDVAAAQDSQPGSAGAPGGQGAGAAEPPYGAVL
jgi:hypothetical protein